MAVSFTLDKKNCVCVNHRMSRNPRQVWFITYGASGPSITHEMLEEDGFFSPEECYTIEGRDFKYTLIKLCREKRPRMAAMEKFLKRVHGKYGIIKNEIFGYDSVTSNGKEGNQIEEHPGFMLMVESMNNGFENFLWWMYSGDIKSYKSGLLWKYRTDIDPEDMPRKFLEQKLRASINKIELLTKEVAVLNASVQTLQQENSRLEDENKQLDHRVKRQYELIYRLDPDNSRAPKKMAV